MKTELSKQLSILQKNYFREEDGIIARYSLIYNSNDLKKINKETSLKDALCGLDELEIISQEFSNFRSTLFAKKSCLIARITMNTEENRKLDAEIDKFLKLLSPYVILSCAHAAVEWLIFNYSINVYTSKSFLFTFLPYYSAKIFPRAMVLLDPGNPTYNFLSYCKTSPIPISFEMLISECVKSHWLIVDYFSWISEGVNLQLIRDETHSPVFSFLTCLVVSFVTNLNESLHLAVDKIIPVITDGLKSESKLFSSACLFIILKITYSVIIKPEITLDMLFKIIENGNLDLNTKIQSVSIISYKQNFDITTDFAVGFILISSWDSEDLFTNVPYSFMQQIFLNVLTYIVANFDNTIYSHFINFVKNSPKGVLYEKYIKIFFLIFESQKFKSSMLENLLSIMFESDSQLLKHTKYFYSDKIALAHFRDDFTQKYFDIVEGDAINILISRIKLASKKRVQLDAVNFLDTIVKNKSMSILKLFTLRKKYLKRALSNESKNHLKSLAFNIIKSNIEEFYKLENNLVILSHIANDFLDFINLLPVIIHEFHSNKEQKIFTGMLITIHENSTEQLKSCVQLLKTCTGLSQFLISLDIKNYIDDILKLLSELDDDYQTKIYLIILITCNIKHHLSAIPSFITALEFFIVKSYEEINDFCNDPFNYFIIEYDKSNQKRVLVECSLWALNNLIQYYEFDNSSTHENLMVSLLKTIIYFSYSTDQSESIQRNNMQILNNFLNSLLSKNKFSEFFNSYIINLLDLNDENIGIHLFTFLLFLKDFINTNIMVQIKNTNFIKIIIFYLCTYRNKDIRNQAINAIICFNGKGSNEDDLFIKDFSMIKNNILNDANFFKIWMIRYFKNSCKASDYLLDIFIDYLKILNFNNLNLFCMECVISSPHPDIEDLIHQFFVKILSENSKTALKFCNLLMSFTKTHAQILKNSKIVHCLISLSVNDNFKTVLDIIPELSKSFTDVDRKHLVKTLILKSRGKEFSDTIRLISVDSSILLEIIRSLINRFCAFNNFEILHDFDVPLDEIENYIYFILDLLSNENKFVNQNPLMAYLVQCAGQLSTVNANQFLPLVESLLTSISSILSKYSSSKIYGSLNECLNLKHLVDIIRNIQDSKIIELCLEIFSTASKLCPELLLDYLMPLFTFMGSYSVKRDNEATLRTITRVIEVIVPILHEKLPGNNDESMTKIIENFSSSFHHVPKHRHIPLFSSLINSFKSKNSFGIVIHTLLNNDNTDAQAEFQHFFHELSLQFTLLQSFETLIYLLKKIESPEIPEDLQIGQKRKFSSDVPIDMHENIIELALYFLKSDDIKDVYSSLTRESKKDISKIVIQIIQELVIKNEIFKSYIKSESSDELILTLSHYCNNYRFLRAIYKVMRTNIKTCINILHLYSTSISSINTKYSIIEKISLNLIDFITSTDVSNLRNLNIAKKCLFILKNFVKKFDVTSACVLIFEQIINTFEVCINSFSLSISVLWVISETLPQLSIDACQHVPSIIEFITHVQSTYLTDKKAKNVEVIIRCCQYCLEQTLSISDNTLLHQIFPIIYNLYCDSVIFNDFDSIFLINKANKFDASIFTLLNLVASNISAEWVIPPLYKFIKSTDNFQKTGLTYIIFLIHLTIIRANSSVIQSYRSLYIKLFLILLQFKIPRAQNNITIVPEYQILKSMKLFCKFSIKLTEDHFNESCCIIYEHAQKFGGEFYGNTKFTIFYTLLSFLLSKLGGIAIPFVLTIINDILAHLKSISTPDISKISTNNNYVELFSSIIKSVEKIFLYDVSAKIPLNFLLLFVDSLVNCLYLSDIENEIENTNMKINKCLSKHVTGAIANLCVCLKQHDHQIDLVLCLQKLLAHDSGNVRLNALVAFKQILTMCSDITQEISPQISSNLSRLQNDEIESVRTQADIVASMIKE